MYKTCLKTLFAAALFFVMLNCENPFATREPEPPTNSQSKWIQPTSPSYVLVNLKNAIEEKNKSNYLRCLADTSVSARQFKFIPDPAVVAAHPGVFSRWNKEAEANYINQLYSYLPKDSLITVKFEKETETDLEQDSLTTIYTYTLRMHDVCDADSCLRVYTGRAEIRLTRTEDDLWYISYWDDAANSNNLTWSDHKARFGK